MTKFIPLDQAAKTLNVQPGTILLYLRKGDLDGDFKTGQVVAASLEARLAGQLAHRVSNLDAIQAALETDDGLTNEERNYEPGIGRRLPKTGLTDRERDVLQRRAQGEDAESIAARWDISRQMIHTIVRQATQRMANLKNCKKQNL